jgi:UDP-N-acetylmuramate-alanine ligase
MHARPDNPELLRAQELGLKIYSFPEYIYEASRDKQRIVIGGSHGKTSITALHSARAALPRPEVRLTPWAPSWRGST